LLTAVNNVPGVRNVENKLNIQEAANGGQVLPEMELSQSSLQGNWSPSARLVAGTAGGAALAYGLAKRDLVGIGFGAVGAALLARSLSNSEFKRMMNVGIGREAITVQKSINVDASPDVLFGLWANFENFPKFMKNVREVRVESALRSHWVVSGPAGVPVEWDAEITDVIPDKLIAWQSVDGSTVANEGFVRFEANPDSCDIFRGGSENPDGRGFNAHENAARNRTSGP
jgi:uncharacterized membrane protein